MEKILITGASGFVGSHLVEEALGRGLEVFAGVRKSSSRKYLQNARIRFLEMDFADKKNLKEKLKKEKFDYIIHNAGVVSASRPQHYYTVNYEYVKNLIDVLSAEDITPRKFVQMSSLAS
ncbi:MAG TPA: NAD-dependent epimerase/dehydratase family protein, partial [Bacteroidetes bacterium]|nr:NAD-dependent epimerase/dehydratase family protein [Bacteroidota bacterium]